MNIEKTTRAFVYGTERDGKVTKGTISTYEGKDMDDKSKWSSWFCRFVGKAAKPAAKLDDGEQIVLTNAKIENTYDKDKKRSWYNVTVFSFEEYEEEDDK